ncbi:hypothetical protein SAMN05192560_1600 [Methylobacillus rhizosphaerae]|uniref:Uncharacterized protein n=1 Tax=Methylobacillus rhizosphaerae TaxID=551994 RepID=A0A239A0S5_9PROT|nr:hypothetical protein [Methylobacillus rhizosphaerae]SNR88901.1 hypothetical protein SAMN05192560_1600 [Methylobacillus rhizosphaerae]
MKALFRGSVTKGMRLVGVFEDEHQAPIETYLNRLDVADVGNQDKVFYQFVDLTPSSQAEQYGDIPPQSRVILASGGLTRGIVATGPFPTRSIALGYAVNLSFGRTANYYVVDLEPEYAALRTRLNTLVKETALAA